MQKDFLWLRPTSTMRNLWSVIKWISSIFLQFPNQPSAFCERLTNLPKCRLSSGTRNYLGSAPFSRFDRPLCYLFQQEGRWGGCLAARRRGWPAAAVWSPGRLSDRPPATPPLGSPENVCTVRGKSDLDPHDPSRVCTGYLFRTPFMSYFFLFLSHFLPFSLPSFHIYSFKWYFPDSSKTLLSLAESLRVKINVFKLPTNSVLLEALLCMGFVDTLYGVNYQYTSRSSF
jgi:hypothetical protein